MEKAKINSEVCKGCALCVKACAKNIIKLTDSEINSMGYQYALISDLDKCIGCALCAITCPDCAIQVE